MQRVLETCTRARNTKVQLHTLPLYEFLGHAFVSNSIAESACEAARHEVLGCHPKAQGQQRRYMYQAA